MKKRILSVTMVLALVLGVLLSSAVLVAADSSDGPNTVSSSRMVFEGELTYEGGGAYSGTIAMIDENGTSYGDGKSGFDIYAKTGVKATWDQAGSGTQDYACGIIVGHDAYTSAGGWGADYDPDCADWYNYQLTFADGTWALEYNGDVGNDGILTGASAAPMSGTMDWTAKYARETGVGAYYSGMGTAESSGYALNNACTGTNTGVGSWDMDWSWGSDFVPLQYPGFDVSISNLGSGQYRVTLTPAAAGSTQLTVEVPDIVAISVDPTSIDYGTILPGQTSAQKNVTVTNIGTHSVTVDIDVSPDSGTVFDYLELYKSGWIVGTSWDDFITGLGMNASSSVATRLPVPSSYVPGGDEDAALIFTATGE